MRIYKYGVFRGYAWKDYTGEKSAFFSKYETLKEARADIKELTALGILKDGGYPDLLLYRIAPASIGYTFAKKLKSMV